MFDVLVEFYYEWVVEVFEDILFVEGMMIVFDFVFFIERKLFIVNMGYVVIVYFGYLKGKEIID